MQAQLKRERDGSVRAFPAASPPPNTREIRVPPTSKGGDIVAIKNYPMPGPPRCWSMAHQLPSPLDAWAFPPPGPWPPYPVSPLHLGSLPLPRVSCLVANGLAAMHCSLSANNTRHRLVCVKRPTDVVASRPRHACGVQARLSTSSCRWAASPANCSRWTSVAPLSPLCQRGVTFYRLAVNVAGLWTVGGWFAMLGFLFATGAGPERAAPHEVRAGQMLTTSLIQTKRSAAPNSHIQKLGSGCIHMYIFVYKCL